MSRRGENIFKRKDGRWEGRYISDKIGGKTRYRSVYAHSYAECSNKLRLAKCNLLQRSNPITVSELFAQWIQSHRNSVKQSTVSCYHSIYDSYISGYLGKKRVDLLTTPIIENYVCELLEHGGSDGRALSAKTVQGILTMLKAMLYYCESVYGLKNVAANVSMPRYECTEIEVFSKSEIAAFRSALTGAGSYETGVVLCLYTGLRIGEVCALKWGDIDLEDQLLHIRHTLSRIKNPDSDSPKTIVITDTPKSKRSQRDIPLPPFMVAALRALKGGQPNDNYFLTCSTKYTEPRTYSGRYKTILKRIGVTYRNFHVLRHTFATECIKRGIDVKTVSELLGHSSVKITLEKYVHPDLELKRRQLQKLYEE